MSMSVLLWSCQMLRLESGPQNVTFKNAKCTFTLILLHSTLPCSMLQYYCHDQAQCFSVTLLIRCYLNSNIWSIHRQRMLPDATVLLRNETHPVGVYTLQPTPSWPSRQTCALWKCQWRNVEPRKLPWTCVAGMNSAETLFWNLQVNVCGVKNIRWYWVVITVTSVDIVSDIMFEIVA